LKLLSNHPFFEATSLRCRLTKVIEILMERMQLWHHVLEIASSQPRTCHWIVRDLWYDNILITGSRQFAAIVDLGAARYDWPGLDFIRLFGSLMAVAPVSLRHEPQEIWNTAFHAYAERYPNHLIESLEECCVLHEIATQLSIVQWMRWVYGGFFDLTNPQIANRVRNRISDLMVEEIQ
jgi:Ser/Thr protein kinase RdoA (MazF antagonist)